MTSGGRRLWLIGGTGDSAELAAQLGASAIDFVVTVTTPAARHLYAPDVEVWVGKLTEQTADEFLRHYGIVGILDASHPFAIAVSQLAIAVAQRHGLPYLRYERPETAVDDSCDSRADSNITWIDSYCDLVEGGLIQGKRVLLIIGYRALAQFQPWQSMACLHARILPSPLALQAALAAGFDPRRLIALRPPLSPALETALWQQWRIEVVVAKASGQPGGEPAKRDIASRLGTSLILLRRPTLSYPHLVRSLAAALDGSRAMLL